MKLWSVATLAVWITCAAWLKADNSPTLSSAVDLGIDVGNWSAPTTADWDNDGKKDLIVGQYSGGKVRLYINEGTDTSPVFPATAHTFIKAHGTDISTPDRGC